MYCTVPQQTPLRNCLYENVELKIIYNHKTVSCSYLGLKKKSGLDCTYSIKKKSTKSRAQPQHFSLSLVAEVIERLSTMGLYSAVAALLLITTTMASVCDSKPRCNNSV